MKMKICLFIEFFFLNVQNKKVIEIICQNEEMKWCEVV